MADVEKMAAKIIEWTAQKEELEEAIKNARATIAEHIPEGDSVEGDFKFTKYTNKRFDDGLAKKHLKPKVYDSITVVKADSAKAKALLSEEDFEQCKKTFGSVVKIGLRD